MRNPGRSAGGPGLVVHGDLDLKNYQRHDYQESWRVEDGRRVEGGANKVRNGRSDGQKSAGTPGEAGCGTRGEAPTTWPKEKTFNTEAQRSQSKHREDRTKQRRQAPNSGTTPNPKGERGVAPGGAGCATRGESRGTWTSYASAKQSFAKVRSQTQFGNEVKKKKGTGNEKTEPRLMPGGWRRREESGESGE